MTQHQKIDTLVELCGRLAERVEHLLVSSSFHMGGHIVGEAMIGTRLFPHTVGVHEAVGVANAAHQTDCVRVLLVGLAAKAGNEIAGQRDVGNAGANRVDQIEIGLASIALCILSSNNINNYTR